MAPNAGTMYMKCARWGESLAEKKRTAFDIFVVFQYSEGKPQPYTVSFPHFIQMREKATNINKTIRTSILKRARTLFFMLPNIGKYHLFCKRRILYKKEKGRLLSSLYYYIFRY